MIINNNYWFRSSLRNIEDWEQDAAEAEQLDCSCFHEKAMPALKALSGALQWIPWDIGGDWWHIIDRLKDNEGQALDLQRIETAQDRKSSSFGHSQSGLQ